MKKTILTLILVLIMLSCPLCSALAVNPYMDLWEHIPDGEPHVFGDRVYVYGSHDAFRTRMCGPDYHSWSAPVDDLTDWRYEGVSFDGGESGYLLAPDACQGPDGRYYMYAFGDCDQAGGMGSTFAMVADEPQGPYEYIGPVTLGGANQIIFDPAVLVEGDNVYLFGGASNIYRLDPADMTTIVETLGQVQEVNASGEPEQIRNFQEGSSIRKVGDWYVFVYASKYDLTMDYYTVNTNNTDYYNGTLEYAYSKNIEGPYTYGGTIVDIGGENINPTTGTITKAAYNGNTHGGIEQIDGEWYVFFHRQTSGAQTFRQGMIEPLELTWDDEGVYIQQVEVTSQGVEKDGLDPLKRYSAGIACYLRNYPIIFTDVEEGETLTPVTEIHNNAIVGYKYFNFKGEDYKLSIDIQSLGVPGSIAVVLDDPENEPVATFKLDGWTTQNYVTMTEPIGRIDGVHAVYFIFYADSQAEICNFAFLQFSTDNNSASGASNG